MTNDFLNSASPALAGRMPRYAPMVPWCALSGFSRSRTYLELAAGNLRAKKAGKRILIDVEHGLRWIESLPDAQIKPPYSARKAAEQVAA